MASTIVIGCSKVVSGYKQLATSMAEASKQFKIAANSSLPPSQEVLKRIEKEIKYIDESTALESNNRQDTFKGVAR